MSLLQYRYKNRSVTRPPPAIQNILTPIFASASLFLSDFAPNLRADEGLKNWLDLQRHVDKYGVVGIQQFKPKATFRYWNRAGFRSTDHCYSTPLKANKVLKRQSQTIRWKHCLGVHGDKTQIELSLYRCAIHIIILYYRGFIQNAFESYNVMLDI